jgi:hypothetical protein
MIRLSNVIDASGSIVEVYNLKNMIRKYIVSRADAELKMDANSGIIKLYGESYNHILLSLNDNKVPIPADSDRAKKLGRNYLNSKRPTQDQWKVFVSMFDSFPQWGLKFNLHLEDGTVIYQDGVKVAELPSPRTFTTKGA